MLKRIAQLLKLVIAIVAIPFLFDVLIFRSGVYTPWIKFESTAGAVVAATMAIDHYYDASRRNILVLGTSQVGEGFSATIADATGSRPDLHFVNGAIPGTTPRVWNYLLRRIDPDATRFAAIVMMVDYDERFQRFDYPNWPLDTSYLTPLLRLLDLFDYPSSFSAADQREHARRAILFPLLALREDVLAFIAHPLDRAQDVDESRPVWIDAVGTYSGHSEQLPELGLDTATGIPTDWGENAAENRAKFENYFREARRTAAPELQVANLAYFHDWVGRIARRYQAHDVPVIVFCMPRGPWRNELQGAPELGAALRDLRDQRLVAALPADAFIALEQPRFFFDTQHMNTAGRQRFSAMLAQQVTPLLPQSHN